MHLPPHNNPKGKFGENIAAHFLQKKGYKIIERNFRARYGEIDLIATFKNTLVFVEVKTRTGTPFGRPEEAVTYWKLEHLTQVAQYFKQQHAHLPEAMQIDVVAVELDVAGNPLAVNHLPNVTG